MAWYQDSDHLSKSTSDAEHWTHYYSPGDDVPVSGIYKCVSCKKEVTCNRGDPFPPKNHHSHQDDKKMGWELIVRTNTKG